MEKSIEETLFDLFQDYHPQTREDLVGLAKHRLSIPESKIMDSILNLEKNRQIRFPNKTPITKRNYSSFGRYLKSAAHEYWVLVGLTLTTSVVVFSVQDVAPLSYVRYVLGALFVVGLPGFSLSKALWPSGQIQNSGHFELDWPLRIAFSIVLSISIVSVVGLLLDYSSIGVQLSTLVLSLSLLTILFGGIAAFREYRTLKTSTYPTI